MVMKHNQAFILLFLLPTSAQEAEDHWCTVLEAIEMNFSCSKSCLCSRITREIVIHLTFMNYACYLVSFR